MSIKFEHSGKYTFLALDITSWTLFRYFCCTNFFLRLTFFLIYLRRIKIRLKICIGH